MTLREVIDRAWDAFEARLARVAALLAEPDEHPPSLFV
jgi:hypothetical protein